MSIPPVLDFLLFLLEYKLKQRLDVTEAGRRALGWGSSTIASKMLMYCWTD